jgi:DNA invertase Pin-like site-specific DNA recombinase
MFEAEQPDDVDDARNESQRPRAGPNPSRQFRNCRFLGLAFTGLMQVLRDFVAQKVALIIPSAGIDTSKMPGKVLTDILDAISEFKHSAAVEAVTAGLAAAKARGVKLGRPVAI